MYHCPNCRSSQIQIRNIAKKAGACIGTTAGAAAGISTALAGARKGAMIGAIAGPTGTSLGTIAGAILAGLTGGIIGGTAGSRLGEVIDNNALNNLKCLHCGFSFSVKTNGEPFELQELETDWLEGDVDEP